MGTTPAASAGQLRGARRPSPERARICLRGSGCEASFRMPFGSPTFPPLEEERVLRGAPEHAKICLLGSGCKSSLGCLFACPLPLPLLVPLLCPCLEEEMNDI